MHLSHELIESLVQKYERYIAPFTFAIGFALDTLTLTRVDFWIDHLILLGYLVAAGGGIMIFYAYESGRLRWKFMEWGIAFVPIAIQFAFGGLLSAFVIFYTTSASLGKNWVFVLAIAGLLVGNERFRTRYRRLVFQISIFFAALFSYAIFLVPLLVGRLGTAVFLASGAVSIGLVGTFLYGLSRIAPKSGEQFFDGARGVSKNIGALAARIGTLFLAFNILYFANVIPPIPLALKESGVYHSVSRTERGQYALSFEPAPWYLPFQETSHAFHWRLGEPVFYFSSVFAPTRFTLPIIHRWSFYDERQNAWIEKGDIAFPVFGGSDRGYRGYSFKTAIEPGKWRAEVLTQGGQILGRETFAIIRTDSGPRLASVVR